MAISAAHKFTVYDNVDRTVYNTASLTPSANKLYLLWVIGASASTPPVISSVVGGGLTWDLVDTQSGGVFRISLYRALSASPGSAATIDITFSGSPATVGGAWSLWEFDGIDTGGSNGANAIVQSVVGSSSATTTHSLTLAAFANANNRPALGMMINQNTGLTPEAGYIEAGASAGGSPNLTVDSEWNSTTADLTPTFTSGASGAGRMIAVEIAVALAGALAGSASITFGQSGALTGDGALAGTGVLTFGQSGALAGAGRLAGAGALTFGQSGALTGAGALAGATTITFAQTATLQGAGVLVGATTITFGATGTLGSGIGALAGSAAITFGQSGVLTGAGALAGSAAIIFGAQISNAPTTFIMLHLFDRTTLLTLGDRGQLSFLPRSDLVLTLAERSGNLSLQPRTTGLTS